MAVKPGPRAKPAQVESTANGSSSTAASKKAVQDPSQSATATDAVELLKADHRMVEQLFSEYESAAGRSKSDLVSRICKSLTIHTLLEEEIFYPACRNGADGAEEPLDEAQVEHDSAKVLISDLLQRRTRDRFRDAKVKVLAEQVRHHVAEEEKADTGIFALAQKAGLDLVQLGAKLAARKSELEATPELPDARPQSFTTSATGAEAPPTQESAMASRQQSRDRDDRGRFTDDDDRSGRGGRGAGSNGRERDDDGRFTSGRGGSGRDDDDRGGNRGGRGDGRGWFGDSEGHSEAARRGRGRDDDDDRGGRSGGGGGGGGRAMSRGRDDDDDDRGGRSSGRSDGRGWFGDSEGHSEAARRGRGRDDDDDRGGRSGGGRSMSRGRDDDDDDRGGRSSGRGDGRGWLGDSEGHSEAARRGRGRDDDDDRGGRGGRSQARGRDDDDDDRGGRSSSRGGQGGDDGRGWFGDSQGHSEAARRGRGRDDDDDDRGGRSGRSSSHGRDDDDDDRGGRSGRSSSRGREDDDDGRGWFGDSRGHAEAARRGWDSRR